MTISLLDEAEAAITDVWHKRFEQGKPQIGLAASAAIAALAVFEKRQWLGQDDWELLSRIIRYETGEPQEESGYVADAIIAHGFHRRPNCPKRQEGVK